MLLFSAVNETSEKKSQEELRANDKDSRFFDRVQDETKHELLKDKIISRVRHQTLPDEIISKAQFAETLEKKDIEIADLKQEIASLKQELITVKSRNKKLCNILGQGESKYNFKILNKPVVLLCISQTFGRSKFFLEIVENSML